MGGLSSRPSVPTQSQVVFVPAVSSQSPGNTTAENSSSGGNSETKARTESLLKRNRGRLGTIETGFRGLLGQARQNDQKKTLLGE